MDIEEAILYLEHTSYDDFNLEAHQIQNRLNAIKCLIDQVKKQKEVADKAVKYIRNHQLIFKDATLEEIEEWFNQFYIDVLDILKEVSE